MQMVAVVQKLERQIVALESNEVFVDYLDSLAYAREYLLSALFDSASRGVRTCPV